tara:strand:+ start:843 stop:1130 length:288 start_codon:yes stop_codon:yes gene_type:complete
MNQTILRLLKQGNQMNNQLIIDNFLPDKMIKVMSVTKLWIGKDINELDIDDLRNFLIRSNNLRNEFLYKLSHSDWSNILNYIKVRHERMKEEGVI